MATRHRQEPDAPALVWLGDGDRYLVGIPARDLDDSDIASLAGDGDSAALIAALTASGLYQPAEQEHKHG